MGFPWFGKNYQILEILAIPVLDLDMIGAV